MYLSTEEANTFGITLEVERLEPLIEMYSNLIDEYCRTKFAPTEAELKADVVKRIYPPHLPLLSVVEMAYQGTVLAEDVDYYPYPESGVIVLDDPDNFEKRRRSIAVKYTYGYDEIPAAVKRVIADLIKLDTSTTDADGMSRDPTIVSESFDGDYSYSKNSSKTVEDMRRDILSLLDQFVQPEYKAQLQATGNVRARLI